MHRFTLAAFLLAASAALAAEPPAEFFGPLRIRDLSPISMLRLDFVPAHGVESDDLRVVRVSYSHANVYIVSKTVSDYLRARGTDDPLSAQDVDALLAADGDVYYFDGELSLVELEYLRSIAHNTVVQVTWPLHIHGGGYFDRTIEGFHELIGHNTADRDLTSRNDMQVVARLGEDRLVMIDHGTTAGTGDPTVSIRRHFSLGRRTTFVLEGAVKIPVGDESNFFSSGHTDYGVQLSLQKEFARQAFYVGASHVFIGETRIFPNFPLSDPQSAAIAWERKVGRSTWAIAQATWGRAAFRDIDVEEITSDRNQVSIGLRRTLKNRAMLTLALTENVIHFKNTPDFGVHFGIGWILRR